MELEEYARIAAVEDDHWWYRNTRALVADLLAPWLHRTDRLLDAGCGPGGNGAWLAEHGTVVGVDLSPDALAFVRARRPATTPVQASIEALPFADATFDVVVGITVLYTVPDDAAALRELARACRPGGAVLLVEPAFAALGRAHDATVHGRRRYRRTALAELATAAGLTVQRCTYAYSFLAPPAAALGAVDRLRGRRRSPQAPTSTSAPSTACSRRSRRVNAGGWPTTICRSAPRSCCWLRADRARAASPQHDQLHPERREVAQRAEDRADPEELRRAVHAPVVVDPDLGEARARVLQLAHELHADHAGRVHERHPIEGAPADQPEVAVGVADPQPEEELDEAVVHPADHRAHHAVGCARV